MAAFRIVDGYRIEQVAAEPLVVDPIAMAFDAAGALFVIEMRGYSEDGEKSLGRVRRLMDRDGDGRFDTSTVFLDGLSWPTAITCYDGGVFIAAAPDILYGKDVDGDGVADIRRRVFTGFGRGNVQGLVNTLKWGPDQRIHGATSSAGASVRRVYDAGATSIALRGRDFSFDPRRLDLRSESGGGQHGMSFDDWGRKFVSSNSDHLQLVMYEDRHAARNPYLPAPRSRVSIAADGPQAAVFRISPVEPWRIVRTRLRVAGKVRGPIEGGGKPAGYFTGATGVTIVRGDALGEAMRGVAIIGDVGSNIVHRKRIVAKDGVGFVGRRIDQRREFIASKDIWFRPVQFANGPDGALYIADMYREVIEHPKSLPPMIKKHLDLTSGRDRGRIYRVTARDFEQPRDLSLVNQSTAELVQALDSSNGWRRTTASRLLHERRDPAAAPLLRAMAKQRGQASAVQGGDRASSLGVVAALRVLAGLDALRGDDLLPALADGDPRLREVAVRLAERVANESMPVRDRLLAMAGDEDAMVRYRLAFTLGGLKDPRRLPVLTALLKRHGGDPWMRFAALSGLPRDARRVLESVETDEAFSKTTAGAAVKRDLEKLIANRKRLGDNVAPTQVIRRSVQRDAKELAAIDALIKRYQPALREEGDAGRGRELFSKHCSACHRVGDMGKAIGPNLAAMRWRGAQAILVNVLDPNREVNPQYISYRLVTREGEANIGMITAESATSVTLLRGDGSSLTLLRADLQEISQLGLSFMPTGFDKAIPVTQMPDLIAFLMGGGQESDQ